jgi:putative oxidoreductase
MTPMEHTRAFLVTSWVLRLIVAVILFQTLFFKFSAAQESVYIFSTLGMEPWGRIGSGIFELVACVLLVVPSTVTLGALMALAATGSAILFHLAKLGVALTAVGDHGELFALAITVTACSIAILLLHRQELPLIGRSLSTT